MTGITMPFKDRKNAGRKLAEELKAYKGDSSAVVVALPRGGLVLGRVVADDLNLPLDIVVPRKIGAPGQEEYAIGAITEAGEVAWNENERDRYDSAVLREVVSKERSEARRRFDVYRRGMGERVIKDKTIIIVDDGIATGFTMLAAIRTVKAEKPSSVVVAVPVAPSDSIAVIEKEVDELIVLERPELFYAVGAFYDKFDQTTDEEVVKLLRR